MSSSPRIIETKNGQKKVLFTMTTKETYFDKEGRTKVKNHWHRMSAWGKWAQIIPEMGTTGLEVAVEGKLISSFFKTDRGDNKFVSEVEVNDFIIL